MPRVYHKNEGMGKSSGADFDPTRDVNASECEGLGIPYGAYCFTEAPSMDDPANADEAQAINSVGWWYEGIGWVASEESSVPVFRLYNGHAGDHHCTTSRVERDHLVSVGWCAEGIGWHGVAS